MKYLVLSFRNAALCLTDGRISDYVFDSYVRTQGKKLMNRGEHPLAKNSILNRWDKNLFDKSLIGFEQVSNMLHVLCGCRPVPTFKETIRKRLDIIDNITKNVWCKINNLYYYTNKEGIKYPICDFTQGKKIPHNSNRKDLMTSSLYGGTFKGAYITWDSFKKHYYYFDNEKYNQVINKLIEWYGKPTIKEDYSLADLLITLATDRGLRSEMLNFFKDKGMKVIEDIINCKDKTSPFNQSGENRNDNYNLARMPINTAPTYKLYLNGEFIVPIEDSNIYNVIMNGVRYCTFLEGGCVRIKNTIDNIDEDYLEDEGFNQIFISNISSNLLETNELQTT